MKTWLLGVGFLAVAALLAHTSAALTGPAALFGTTTPTDVIHLPAVFKGWPSDRTPTPTPSPTPGPCATPTPDHFQHPPAGWIPLGASTTADFQQCYGYGDLDGDGRSEMVGSYSHSAVGVFLHRQDGSLWHLSVLHPKFDPALNHVKGMQGGWPVKGLVTGDFDGDGRTEIITSADAISYPPIHGNGDDTIPFPGCIYVDWIAGQGFVANPLVWGQWGETLASNRAAIMAPVPVPMAFRSGLTLPGRFDFLVTTMHEEDGLAGSRLFVLEQPPGAFSSVDYRSGGSEPYPDEPSYVQHLYLATTGGDIPLAFSPTEVDGAVGAQAWANVGDFDRDGLVDLVVAVSFYDSDNEFVTGSVRVYRRLSPAAGRRYRFQEAFRQDVRGASFWSPLPADLNGDPADGKEGWIMSLRVDSQWRRFGVNGLATLQRTADGWQLLGTHATDRAEAQVNYRDVYSNPAVLDADGDGRDDAVAYLVRGLVRFPYGDKGYGSYGDLILFRNVGGAVRGYPELFSLDEGEARVLWRNDSFSWDVHAADFNDDGKGEVGCALTRREPAWPAAGGGATGGFQVYYAPITWP